MRWTLLLCILIPAFGASQDFPRSDFNLEKLVDEIFPMQDLDLNYDELYENLAQLLSNPYDLNSVTQEQLRSLLVLTEGEINSFLNHRTQYGPFISVYELQAIPGWTRQTFDKVIPFVLVTEQQSKFNTSIFKRAFEEQNNYLLLRVERSLETKKGYLTDTEPSQHYAGSPEKLYARFRVSRSNDFSFGFTLEKDPGETMTWQPAQSQYGFDYISFHGQVQNKGKITNLIVGDYQCQFGQGLVLGSVFGFGKNAETITTVRRSNLGFLPYTSASENTFLRGVASTVTLSRLVYFHSFISRALRDGNQTETEGNSFATSLSASGLHRTPSEIEDRQKIEDVDFGAVIQYKKQALDAGVIYHHINLSSPLLRDPTPYNQFSFNGVTNNNASMYLNFSWANFTFFGEAAQTLGHGAGVTAGLLGNLTSALEVSLLYRNFSRDYYSFYPNALAENTTPQNEQGLYWGWKYKFSRKYSASGYFDMFVFPWLRYRGYAPSDGNEWLLRFNFTPSKTVNFFVQAREESKIRNLSEASNLYATATGVKRNFWVNCDYAVPPYFTFKTRIQFSDYRLSSSITRGIAIIQDVSLSTGRWTLSGRYALFDTDDYDNRLYAYEKNMWMAYSFPAYYGVGVRTFVMVQYKLTKKIDLWLRWSQTRYADLDGIGTGTEIIAGNTSNDAKFQVKIRF